MQRLTLHQVRGEWRSNLWIVVEMLLVSVILWFIVDSLYVLLHTHLQPNGFDSSHCYYIRLTEVGEDARPPYSVADDISDDEAIRKICERIRSLPDVEALTVASDNSRPYTISSAISQIQMDSIWSHPIETMYLFEPGYFRVFRIHGVNGETPEELEAIIADRRHFIASANLMDGMTAADLVGRRFDNGWLLGCVTVNQKKSEYDDVDEYATAYYPVYDRKLNIYSAISIRVYPEADVDFKERFWEVADKNLTEGKYCIQEIQSYDELAESYNFVNDRSKHLFLIGIFFLLLNVFLGLLGTFWFRCRQRIPEMSLQKAMGFTGRQIFRNQIREGLILLLTATIPALIIDVNLAIVPITKPIAGQTLTPGRFALAAGMAFVLMFAVMVAGIAIPARNVGRIQPVEGLHRE